MYEQSHEFDDTNDESKHQGAEEECKEYFASWVTHFTHGVQPWFDRPLLADHGLQSLLVKSDAIGRQNEYK
jgi:hypothetical protein